MPEPPPPGPGGAVPCPTVLPMPSPPELARRLPRCILGLAAFGAGIAAIVAADVGLAPWDVFHQGASERLGLSIGTVIEGVGLLLLLLWIPLRQRFGIGTLLNALEIGIVVDLVLPHLHTPDPLVGRLALLGDELARERCQRAGERRTRRADAA